MDVQQVSAAALEKVKAILAAGPEGIKKDLTSGSGFAGYNLQPAAILLQPVITPWRNNIPRVTNTRGGTSAEWRAIAGLVTKTTNPFVTAEGAKGNKINYAAVPKTAPFQEIALGDSVTWAAEDAARGFEGDIRARAVSNLLLALMLMEEQVIGFGRTTNLPAVTAPTVTKTDVGGLITAATYHVIVRAITGLGDGTNSVGRKSTATNIVVTAATSTITASTPWVEGAIGYEWWIDGDGANANWTLQATTGINSVTLTAALLNTGVGAPPADNLPNALAIDGLIAQLTAAAGAQVKTLANGTLGIGTDFTLDDVDAQNKAVWDNAKADPETIWMNSTQIARATNLVLASNGAPSLFVQGVAGMQELTGGYMLAKYVNKSTGRVQNVRVHPYLPDGTMVAYSNVIPFPTGGDMVGIDIETSRDYQQVDYALTARRYDFEVFAREALRLKFPGGAWVVRNVRSNTTV